MTSRLAIVRPLAFSALGGTLEFVSRLATPDPKEAALSGAGPRTIDIDLGSVQDFDTIFLGYTNAGAAHVPFTLSHGAASYTTVLNGNVNPANSQLFEVRRHFLRVLAAPVSARYIRLSATLAAGFTAGVLAVGKSFQAFWGHEYGSGRPIDDTGTADRLFSGGFGINEGVATSGYQWTFGDLTMDERAQLFSIVRDRKTTRSVLVVEDFEETADLNERIHWGLFNRLEAYERADPINTRWNLRVWDWA